MSTGDNIGADISTVGAVVAPILAVVAPQYAAPITLAFKLLAIIEPAAYNAVAALVSGQALTAEQEATIQAVEAKLQNPDSYLS